MSQSEIKQHVIEVIQPHFPEIKRTLDQFVIDVELKMEISQQDKILDEVKNGERKLSNSLEKGNYGEMRTDQDLAEKGYERISVNRVTDLNDSTHQGIDGVYYKKGGEPEYLIVDSKFRSAQLGETSDGKQMSEAWIDNRLDSAVGKEKADEIRMEKIMNSNNICSLVSHVDECGNITYDKLDSNGNVTERNVQL